MNGYQTEQRKLLLAFLKENPDTLFSAKELFAKLPEGMMNLSTLYRNLSRLEKDARITKHAKEGSRDAFYQYTNHVHCQNSIHLTCTKCHKTFHMNMGSAVQMVDAVQKQDEFVINKEKSMLYGLCKKCIK